MRYSSKSAVEYDLAQHYELLKEYESRSRELGKYRGSLIKTSRKRNRCYYNVRYRGDSNYTYVGGEDSSELMHARESAFYDKMIEVLQDNISVMEEFLKVYRNTHAENINELLGRLYALPHDSVILIDDKDTNRWMEECRARIRRRPSFDQDSLKMTAFDGTKMRSRAEVVHYEAFYILNIPAVYEVPYETADDVLRPDFSFMDVFAGDTKVLEHLGNWFHSDEYKRNRYRMDALHRIDQLGTIGFEPEVSLILTFGMQDNMFDAQAILRKLSVFSNPLPSMDTMKMLRNM